MASSLARNSLRSGSAAAGAAGHDEWHRGRAAFERDRERDAILATKGYRTLRFTDRQIEDAPAVVAGTLRAALTARAA